ncbi:hypothetical protein ACIQTN_25820 [Streptomyces werraensis]|uniref:hypothetical protein n=1 Tax=Streptomyces werraensis TaxID=68284 RepID=UPI003819FA7A
MTDMPPMPATPPAPPAKPKRARSTNAIILGSAAAVIAAVIGTGIFVVQAMNDEDRPATTSSSSRATDEPEPVVEDDVEEPDLDLYVTDPTAADFEIELRTKSRQCFGSAGCNLVVEPELTYNGDTSELDPALTYEITYEITGDESGPILQTAELTDQTTLTFDTTVISTESRGTELSVEVTGVTTSEW